jgi:hypothetical protein
MNGGNFSTNNFNIPIATNSVSGFGGTVSLNGIVGQLTITGVTLTTGSIGVLTVDNTSVLSTSTVFVNIISVPATTNCLIVNATSVSSGSFQLIVFNAGPNISSGTIQIACLVMN